MQRTFTICCRLLLLLSALGIGASAEAASELRLSSASAPGGSNVTTLLTIQGGAGVAGIQTEINFDPQVLSFGQATAGQVGSLFDLSSAAADGRLFLTLARTEGLVSGQGVLARLNFVINPGAKPGVTSDLVVAQAVVVNDAGAHLENERYVVNSSASVSVAVTNFSEFVDLDGDGLSDDWEDTHRLPTDRANVWEDPDNDRRLNLVEYAVGSNPLVADAEPVLRVYPEEQNGESYLALSHFRNKAATNIEFFFEVSENLVHWSPLPESAVTVQVIDHGATEQVILREINPMKSAATHFVRLGFRLE